ncbi:phosphotransferase [Candidatus Lucifugimonas marina]|uniref:Phosphotransferase n=1 Tax=Candidatus Lucifugimonas marina TaxID=3038979 RepID=A0AAJ5ZEF2_9CHLR|nr:phosphotransferase [SAR202 cluster bacterium JH1073]
MRKPDLKQSDVVESLAAMFGSGFDVGGITNLELLPNGMVASVYSFYVIRDGDASGYIARFLSGDRGEAARRTKFVVDMIGQSGSPFPVANVIGIADVRMREYTPVAEEGAGGGLVDISVIVMERLEGDPLEQIQDKPHLVPAVVASMAAIRQVDVSSTSGWGAIGADGNGNFDSWRDALASVSAGIDEFVTGDARKIYREEDFDYFYGRLAEYWEAMPASDRSLVHADWGWDNVLILDGEVSAVVDWDGALYGDPLLDPARQDFYYPEIDFRSRFAEFYEQIGWSPENFDERWLACQLWAILNDLKWYSVAGWDEPYAWIKERTRNLLGEGPAVGRHP